MAKKPVDKLEERVKKIKMLYGDESPIKGADPKKVNKQLEDGLTGPRIDEVEGEEITIIDGLESEEHFLAGIVPAGFSKTYGEEVTGQYEGPIGDILTMLDTIFAPEDKFRYFFKYVDNYRFTVVVPIRFSNMDDQSYAVFRVDARSVTLQPGNIKQQIETRAKRFAAHLKYEKKR